MSEAGNVRTKGAESLDSAAAVQLGLPELPAVASLYRIRLRPAEFARLLGVAKSSVTSWTHRGIVRVGVDGRLDPALAIKTLLSRPDAGRLRSRFLAEAFEEFDELRRERDAARALAARVPELERELAAAIARAADADGAGDAMAARVFEIVEAVRAALALMPPDHPGAALLAAALGGDADG